MNETSKYFVGIDLHKTITQVCVVDRGGEIVEERRFTGGSLKEGMQVIEFLARWSGGLFCVEAVGFNRWLVNACLQEGLEIVVVDPVKLNLRMLGKKTLAWSARRPTTMPGSDGRRMLSRHVGSLQTTRSPISGAAF